MIFGVLVLLLRGFVVVLNTNVVVMTMQYNHNQLKN